MGTRSTIAMVKDDGSVESVYCHWDGYPSNNGKLLLDNYSDAAKIQALLDIGDMSSLAESIDCPEGHSYSSAVDGHTVFYGRDRGEDNVDKRTFTDMDQYMAGGGEEYNYLFVNNKWLCDGEDLTSEMCSEL